MQRLLCFTVAGFLAVTGVLAAQNPPRDPKPPATAPATVEPDPASPESISALLVKLKAEIARAPDNPEPHYRLAAVFEDLVRRDGRLTVAQKQDYIQQGLQSADAALALDPDYTEALIFKSLLLRQQMLIATDPEQQKALRAQADALRNRALEIRKAGTPGQEAPVPAAPASPCRLASPDGTAPVRVGGTVKPPARTRHAAPVYPPDAQTAKVSGVVIVEVLIDRSGLVADACVQRSIPLLDDAALDAVRQWEFEPTWVDGVAMPVVMTVTVNFTLQ